MPIYPDTPRDVKYALRCIYEAATAEDPNLEGNAKAMRDVAGDFFYAGNPLAHISKEMEAYWRNMPDEEKRKLIEDIV